MDGLDSVVIARMCVRYAGVDSSRICNHSIGDDFSPVKTPHQGNFRLIEMDDFGTLVEVKNHVKFPDSSRKKPP